jgi:DNA-binding NarL/FixJ family response regulator
MRRVEHLESIVFGPREPLPDYPPRLNEPDLKNKCYASQDGQPELAKGSLRRNVSLQEQQRILELYVEGNPSTEIARLTGWSKQTVINQLRNAGAQLRQPGRTKKGTTSDDTEI